MHDSKKSLKESSRRGLKESDDIEVLYRKNGEWVPEKDLEEDMSPEDAEDNKILQGIYAKMQKKVNTKLTPEEQFIMDKYGLSYPYGYSSSSQNPKFKNKSPVVKYPNGGTLPLVDIEDSNNVDKINLPDKARKMRSRVLNRAPLDRDTKDAQYRYFDVKSHLNNIKNSKQRLKDMDTNNIVDPSYVSSKYQGPATGDSLGADIDFYRNRRASDRDFLQNSIKDNQDYINKLLRRDESYKKRLKESEGSEIIAQYSIDVYQDRSMSTEKMEKLIMDILQNNGLTVAGCMSTDTSWDVEDYYG